MISLVMSDTPKPQAIENIKPHVQRVIINLLQKLKDMESRWETKVSKVNDLSATVVASSIFLNHKINIIQTKEISFKTYLANIPKVLKITDNLLNVHDELITIYSDLLTIYSNLSSAARWLFASMTDNNLNLLHNVLYLSTYSKYEDFNHRLRFYFEASDLGVGYWSSILYWKNVFTILKEKTFLSSTLFRTQTFNRDSTVHLMILAKELLSFSDQRLESFKRWIVNASYDISKVVSIVESFIPEESLGS